MMPADIKRNLSRSMLLLHCLGLTLTLGIRFVAFVVENATEGGSLQTLAVGRDLNAALALRLAFPGLLLTIISGVVMVFIRYGRRPPAWVWIKVALTSAALVLAITFVAPTLVAARYWADWSAAHGQLATQFHDSVARSRVAGGILVLLVFLNIPVAIWKPFLSVIPFKGKAPKSAVQTDSGISAHSAVPPQELQMSASNEKSRLDHDARAHGIAPPASSG